MLRKLKEEGVMLRERKGGGTMLREGKGEGVMLRESKGEGAMLRKRKGEGTMLGRNAVRVLPVGLTAFSVLILLAGICSSSVYASESTSISTNSASTLENPKTEEVLNSTNGQLPGNLVNVDPSIFEGLSGDLTFFPGVGGAPGQVIRNSGFALFTKLTGVEVKPGTSDNSLTKFMAAAEAGSDVPWSLIEVGNVGEMLRAKKAGFLQKLDPDIVPFENVLPKFRDPYMVPVGTTSGVVITWNTNVFPLSGNHPTSTKDFFNIKEFPGKRCMHKTSTGQSVLELALYADGVPPEEIYPLDVDRALDKLASIADQTIWIGGGYDRVIQGLLNGTCVMTWAPEGRSFVAVKKYDAPLAIAWDGAYYWTGYMAVPKGAPNPEAAMAAIAVWASSKEANLELTKKTSYINRLNILSMEDYPAELHDWLPIAEIRPNPIEDNGKYWMTHVGEVQEKFLSWVASGAGQ